MLECVTIIYIAIHMASYKHAGNAVSCMHACMHACTHMHLAINTELP